MPQSFLLLAKLKAKGLAQTKHHILKHIIKQLTETRRYCWEVAWLKWKWL